MAHLTLVKLETDRLDNSSSGGLQQDCPLSLLSDAKAIECLHGKNLYSDFILKNRVRPDSQQAKAIACLIGGRVKDRDGKLQPGLTFEEKSTRQNSRAQTRKKAQSWRALSLISAVASHNHLDPSDLLQHSRCSDEESIRSHLRAAIEWLARIDSELQARENQAFGAT